MAISSSDLILKFANEQLNARNSVNRLSLDENEVSFGENGRNFVKIQSITTSMFSNDQLLDYREGSSFLFSFFYFIFSFNKMNRNFVLIDFTFMIETLHVFDFSSEAVNSFT